MDRTAALDLLTRYYAAFNAGDWQGMLDCLAEDVVHDINQGVSQHGKDAFLKERAEPIAELREAGIAEPQRLMAPLLSASLDNALRHGDSALTGPVARGDARTVAEHLTRMGDLSPVVTDAYRAMARLTADRALAAGLIDMSAAEELLDVLATKEAGR